MKNAILKWFLDFIYLDLQKIEGREFIYLSQQLTVVNSYGPRVADPKEFMEEMKLESSSVRSFIDWDDPEEQTRFRKFLVESQKNIRDVAEDLFQKIKKAKSGQLKGFIPLKEISASYTLMPYITGTADIEDVPRESSEMDSGESKLHAKKYREQRSISCSYGYDSKSDELGCVFQFFHALQGVTIDSFLVCPECKNWFVATTKKEKIYCTNKCAARFKGRENRQAKKRLDPEGHAIELEKAAMRARKSYVKKIKAKIPKAQVERRPIKYKKGE